MTEHKFKIGQLVLFRRKNVDARSGPYQIVKRLPAIDGEFQYEIRSAFEEHNRVVKESDLLRA